MAEHHHHHHHHDTTSETTTAHSHGHDYVAANREHFSGAVSDFEKPQWIELAAVFRKHYHFDEEKTTVMDFACGVGLISRELAAYSKSIVGVDITQPLVDVYNERVSNQGITPEEMRAVCVELKGEEGELDGLKFDVIVCASSYHHFESIESITKMLVFFLKPGGSLLVADILDTEEAEASSSSSDPVVQEKYQHVVPHKHGFKKERIQGVFEGAGLTSFMLEIAFDEKIKIGGRDVTYFLAKGTKPSA